jgi:hypothetical protein
MNRDVFLSILAMDSYNRGYGSSIAGMSESGQIGSAAIRAFNVGEQAGWQAAGFYAIAYTVSGVEGIADGTTVISYRGTNFDLKGWLSSPAVKDITNGWSLFTGFGSDSQANLAEQFFTAVTGAGFPDGTASGPGNTILTGHSLGAALAAYVGTQGIVTTVAFDPIPYARAVLENVLSRAMAATISKLGLTLESVAAATQNRAHRCGLFFASLAMTKRGEAIAL